MENARPLTNITGLLNKLLHAVPNHKLCTITQEDSQLKCQFSTTTVNSQTPTSKGTIHRFENPPDDISILHDHIGYPIILHTTELIQKYFYMWVLGALSLSEITMSENFVAKKA